MTVFTDIDCGYCRKLHTQISDYNKAGISVEYLFFPRAGLNSEFLQQGRQRLVRQRPAQGPDRRQGRPAGGQEDLRRTRSPWITSWARKIGVDGTPAIYAADGTQIGGYLSPAECWPGCSAKLPSR